MLSLIFSICAFAFFPCYKTVANSAAERTMIPYLNNSALGRCLDLWHYKVRRSCYCSPRCPFLRSIGLLYQNIGRHCRDLIHGPSPTKLCLTTDTQDVWPQWHGPSRARVKRDLHVTCCLPLPRPVWPSCQSRILLVCFQFVGDGV